MNETALGGMHPVAAESRAPRRHLQNRWLDLPIPESRIYAS